ncbi:MAG TPA: hypothetical protein VFS95_08405 [Telluria sp.]|nr:hypothetical protein [Telluria sp.]
MKIAGIFASVILLSTLTGCTTELIYGSLQDSARDRCAKLSETDRAACLRNASTSYDSYQADRARATGNAHN